MGKHAGLDLEAICQLGFHPRSSLPQSCLWGSRASRHLSCALTTNPVSFMIYMYMAPSQRFPCKDPYALTDFKLSFKDSGALIKLPFWNLIRMSHVLFLDLGSIILFLKSMQQVVGWKTTLHGHTARMQPLLCTKTGMNTSHQLANNPVNRLCDYETTC